MLEKLRKKAEPGLLLSIITLVFLIVALVTSVLLFGDGATGGPAQMALICAGIFAAIVAVIYGKKWEDLESSMLQTMADVMKPVIILLLIGALIGVWILSGIVPAIIVWGLKILKPPMCRTSMRSICLIPEMP